MKIKSHLFEIMQFCFLHSVLLFLYLSVLLKPNFLYKKKRRKEYLVFSCTVTYIKRDSTVQKSSRDSTVQKHWLNRRRHFYPAWATLASWVPRWLFLQLWVLDLWACLVPGLQGPPRCRWRRWNMCSGSPQKSCLQPDSPSASWPACKLKLHEDWRQKEGTCCQGRYGVCY